jgi:hypothetical protein
MGFVPAPWKRAFNTTEVLELRREVGVIAAPAMHQNNRDFAACHLLVPEADPVAIE